MTERADTIAVGSLVAAVAQDVFNAILAISRIHQSHWPPKWQQLLANLRRAPAALQSRLEALGRLGTIATLAEAEALVYDTIELAEGELNLELTSLRRTLAERRHVIELPSTA